MLRPSEAIKCGVFVAVQMFAVLLFIPAVPAQICTESAPGFVSGWSWNGNGTDVQGTNSVLLVGNPVFVAAKVGQGLLLNGVNQHARIPASGDLDLGAGSGFTVEMWINPARLDRQTPLVEWSTANRYGAHFWMSVSPPFGSGTGCIYGNLFGTDPYDPVITSGPGVLAVNVYQHVGLTYDKATGAARLFLNGAVMAEKNLGNVRPITSGHDLYVGHRAVGILAGSSYAGVIDDLGVYDRALSQGEIQAIVNAGSAGKCPSQAADLSVAITSPMQRVYRGEKVAYSLRVMNQGSHRAVDTVLTYKLPLGAALGAITPAQGSFDVFSDRLEFKPGTLGTNAISTLSVEVLMPNSDSATNTVSVSSATKDANLANNKVSLITTILPPPQLLIEQSRQLMVLAWPSSDKEFVVETNSTLAPEVPWIEVRHSTVGSQNIVAFAPTEAARFFRLRLKR